MALKKELKINPRWPVSLGSTFPTGWVGLGWVGGLRLFSGIFLVYGHMYVWDFNFKYVRVGVRINKREKEV